MNRQLAEHNRVLSEIRDRLGVTDAIVAQWTSELEERVAFEFRYPTKLEPRKRTAPLMPPSLLGVRYHPTTRLLRKISVPSLREHH